ncbi:hypothetical protein [Maribacter sp. 2210JD10-5]|uniref:hypothetical protein n=1 Tax=Maribacter sp. 2210JD10-5 TaxID=3386272 RepID=UPI0039BC2748
MRIKLYPIVLLFLFFKSCNSSDGIDCALVDCAAQGFSIVFVDSDGTNLIENGTFSIADITISKNGKQLGFNASEENQIFFEVAGQQGENIYEITLSESRTDELILDLNRTNSGSECCSPFFDVNSASYTNSSNVLIETDSFIVEFIIVID